MKRSRFFVLFLVATAWALVSADAFAQDGQDFGRPATRLKAERAAETGNAADSLFLRASYRETMIVNTVHDLLDEDVAVDALPGEIVWESEPFDTSPYNRIGIRADVEAEGGTISCSTWWQFTRDDAFLAGQPTTLMSFVFIGDDPGEQAPDGIPDLFLATPGSSFAGISGLRAKVVCHVVQFGRRDVFPDSGFEPTPVIGTISDVKVLLRRE